MTLTIRVAIALSFLACSHVYAESPQKIDASNSATASEDQDDDDMPCKEVAPGKIVCIDPSGTGMDLSDPEPPSKAATTTLKVMTAVSRVLELPFVLGAYPVIKALEATGVSKTDVQLPKIWESDSIAGGRIENPKSKPDTEK